MESCLLKKWRRENRPWERGLFALTPDNIVSTIVVTIVVTKPNTHLPFYSEWNCWKSATSQGLYFPVYFISGCVCVTSRVMCVEGMSSSLSSSVAILWGSQVDGGNHIMEGTRVIKNLVCPCPWFLGGIF